MVRRDDTLQSAPVERALHADPRLTREETGTVEEVDYIDTLRIQVVDMHLVEPAPQMFTIVDAWVLESEIMIEHNRRRSRQTALRRIWAYLRTVVHPLLVDRVRMRFEQESVRVYFRTYIQPRVYHEYALRAMERSLAGRVGGANQMNLRELAPPPLARQVASAGPFLNGGPRTSQIASSHGSITETDDLAALRGRSVSLAQSARYNRSGNHSSSRGVDLGGGGGRGVRAWQQALIATVVPPNDDPPDTEYVVFRPGVPFGWFRGFVAAPQEQQVYYQRGTGSLQERTSAVYLGMGSFGVHTPDGRAPCFYGTTEDDEGLVYRDVVQEGQLLEGYINDGGAYVPSSKHTGRRAVFPFIRVDEVEGWVYMPAMRKVLKEFGACLATECNLRTVLNMLNRDYASLPADMKSSIVSVYRMVNMKMQEVIKGKPSRVFPPSIQVLRYIDMAPVGVVIHPGLHKLEYQRCDLTPEASVHKRRDILVVQSEVGGQMVDGCIEWVTPCVKTLKTVLVGARFRGVKDFVFYSNNSQNQSSSMVRVFKCRGGTALEDREYARLQNTFVFDAFWCSHKKFQTTGRIKVNYDHDLLHSVDYTIDRPTRQLMRMESPHHEVIGQVFKQMFTAYSVVAGFWSVVLWCEKMIGAPLGVVGTLISESASRLGVEVVDTLTAPFVAMLWLLDFVTLRFYYSQLDHAKKKLRRSVGEALYGANRRAPSSFVGRIAAQVKDEPAKPGKPPRLYFNLGVISSMFGGAHIEVAKKNLHGERRVMFRDWRIRTQFVYENSFSCVTSLFREGWASYCKQERELYALFMSDDVAVVTPDGFYELDISMCDASIGPGIFWLVHQYLTSCSVPGVVTEGLLAQLAKPVVVENPSNRRESIVWKFLTYYLVSGTVLTTLTDSIASLMVISAFSAAYVEGVRDPADFVGYFKSIGLAVTVERREWYSQMTMLKRRPLLSEEGEIIAPLAVATLFKRVGIIDTDLLLATRLMVGATLEERAAAFIGAVVDSWKSEPHHPLMDAMREAFPVVSPVELPVDFSGDKRFDSKRVVQRVSVASLCESYGISESEYDEAVQLAREMRVGAYVKCAFMSRAFEVDYGL